MRPNHILVLSLQGKRIEITSAKNFIEEWNFTTDGSQLVLLTRGSHGPAFADLHDTKTGGLVASFKIGEENPPAWAEPYKDR